MATTVDICNLALAMLGGEAGIVSVNPPDGSDQAGHCKRFYPMALKKISEEHDWHFAKCRIRLSKLSTIDAELYGYKYAYSVPANCSRILSVSSINKNVTRQPNSEKQEDFLVEFNSSSQSRIVLTNAENAMMHYTSIADNPQLFPGYFSDALVILLASFLVGPIKRSDSSSTMSLNLLKQYEQALSRAKSLDNQSAGYMKKLHIPSSFKARQV